MKFLFAILGFVAVVFQTTAQTNNVKNGFETITVTNWVKPGPFLRIVNGQLYNTAYSKLWGDPITLMPIRKTIANNGHFLRYELVANTIGKDSVFCDVDAITWWPETYTAAPQDEDRETIKSVVIYHYPNPEKLVTGQPFSCRCMKVENLLSHGTSYEAYDCGVQSTNLVAVVKEQKIKVASANLLQTNTGEKQ